MAGAPNVSSPFEAFDVGASINEPKDDQKPQVEVVIDDDTPDKDKGRPRRKADHKPYEVSDDEIEKYDEGVKNRIKKLRFEYHEERRLKEEASRREQAAIEYARKLVAENSRLTSTLQQGESTLVEVAKAKAMASVDSAKRALAEAHAAGDADKIAEATANITKYYSEVQALESHQPSIRGKVPTPEESVQDFDKRYQQVNRPSGPHQKAVEWYQRNKDWFEVDPVMTQYAKWMDAERIKRGSSPASDEHYEYIDTEMRRLFPDKFKDVAPADQQDDQQELVVEPPRQRQQTQQRVAPVSRSAPSVQSNVQRRPSQVRLTQSEAAIARKLGLSLEQYAEQKMKDYPDGY